METYLETVTLWCKGNVMPGIPSRNTPGELWAEDAGLIFHAKHSNFTYAFAWSHIKSCYAFSQMGLDVRSTAVRYLTLFTTSANEWFVMLSAFSAVHDMDITVAFFIGNTADGPRTMERRANALAKTLWTLRSVNLQDVREGAIVRYRSEWR